MEDTDLYSPRKSLIITSMNEGIQEDDYDAMLNLTRSDIVNWQILIQAP